MQTKQGKFIVVEGLEGAGKSTALALIQQELINRGIDVITTREPGGTEIGEGVRQWIKSRALREPLDSRAELLLVYASRIQLIEHVIRPALSQGTWVLADRFELSTFAYQGGGRQLDKKMITHLSAFCVGALQPNLTLFLDIPPEIGLKRAMKRGKIDRMEKESMHFFKRVYDTYHEQLARMKNVAIIDASMPLKQVHEAIYDALATHHMVGDHA